MYYENYTNNLRFRCVFSFLKCDIIELEKGFELFKFANNDIDQHLEFFRFQSEIDLR